MSPLFVWRNCTTNSVGIRYISAASVQGSGSLSTSRDSTGSIRSRRSRSPCYPSGAKDQYENEAVHSSHGWNDEDDVNNSSMVRRTTGTRSSSDASNYNSFSPAFRDSEVVEGVAAQDEMKGNGYDNGCDGLVFPEDEKGEEEEDFIRGRSKTDYLE